MRCRPYRTAQWLGALLLAAVGGCGQPTQPLAVGGGDATTRRLPPAKPRVVEIRAPTGDPRFLWADPGDALVLHETLPFPYRYNGGATLIWTRDDHLVRVNGRAAAVDLSAVPPTRMHKVATAARKAGARCAFWQGPPRMSKALVQALAHQPLACVGLRLHAGAAADEVVGRLAPLAPKLRLLDAALHSLAPESVKRLVALRVLLIRELDTPSMPRDELALWRAVRSLKELKHLHVASNQRALNMIRTLRKLPRLHRLELPSLQLGEDLWELGSLPRLTSLTVGMADMYTGGVDPAAKARPMLRELRLVRIPNHQNKYSRRWLRRLRELRILAYWLPDPAPTDLKHLSKLELLDVTHLTVKDLASGLPRGLRRLHIRALDTDALEKGSTPPKGAPSGLRDLTVIHANLHGKRARVLHATKGLEAFRCVRCDLDDDTLRALGQLGSLTSLELKFSHPSGPPPHIVATPSGIRHLRHLKRLTRLGLTQGPVDDATLRQLALLTRLTRLDLSHTRVSDASADVLAGLVRLRWLSLRATRVSTPGIRKLAGLRHLEHLDLSATATGDEALATLGRLSKLRWLSLEATHLAGRGLGSLRRLKQLRVLKLCHATLETGALAREGLPANLHHLELSAIPLSKSDVTTVTRLPRLQELWAINCRLQGNSLRTLAQAKQLTTLIIPFNRLQPADLPLLLKLPRLQRVAFQYNKLTHSQETDFQSRNPYLRFR